MIKDAWGRNDPYRPRLKIFLSCDIVGSTAYKQPFIDTKSQSSPIEAVTFRRRWQDLVHDFYRDLPEKFKVNWETQLSDWELKKPDKNEDGVEPRYDDPAKAYLANKLCGRSPFLWKTIGDEIIFWKELSHEHQLWPLISSWKKSLAEIRPRLLKERLDLKSTIWLAEFPVRNATMVPEFKPKDKTADEYVAGEPSGLVPESGDYAKAGRDTVRHKYYTKPTDTQNQTDFVGPGVDLGFRLSSLASSKRMMVSVDVAYLLALSWLTLHQNTVKSNVKMRSLGSRVPLSFTDDDTGQQNVDITGKLDFLKRPSEFSVQGKLRDMKLNFSGSKQLKGVLGGVKYPVFWINSVPAESVQEFKDRMYITKEGELAKRPGVQWQDVLDFCLAFYDDREAYLMPPVIVPNKKICYMLENPDADPNALDSDPEELKRRVADFDATLTPNKLREKAEIWTATYQKEWFVSYLKGVGIVKAWPEPPEDDPDPPSDAEEVSEAVS